MGLSLLFGIFLLAFLVRVEGCDYRSPIGRSAYFFGLIFSVTVLLGFFVASFLGTNWPVTALRTRVPIADILLSLKEITLVKKIQPIIELKCCPLTSDLAFRSNPCPNLPASKLGHRFFENFTKYVFFS